MSAAISCRKPYTLVVHLVQYDMEAYTTTTVFLAVVSNYGLLLVIDSAIVEF